MPSAWSAGKSTLFHTKDVLAPNCKFRGLKSHQQQQRPVHHITLVTKEASRHHRACGLVAPGSISAYAMCQPGYSRQTVAQALLSSAPASYTGIHCVGEYTEGVCGSRPGARPPQRGAPEAPEVFPASALLGRGGDARTEVPVLCAAGADPSEGGRFTQGCCEPSSHHMQLYQPSIRAVT